MTNKPMMVCEMESQPISLEDPNEQSLLNRVGRIYNKHQEFRLKLLTINDVIINGGVDPIVEPKASCIIDYLQEIENTLDDTMCLAEHILSILASDPELLGQVKRFVGTKYKQMKAKIQGRKETL